jgi:hypothetical protein
MTRMRRVRLRTGSIAAVVCGVLACLAPVSIGAARGVALPHELRVDLAEWAAVPSDGVVSAGPVRLEVRNAGLLDHELAIVPTRSWGGELRIRDGQAVVGEVAARPILVRPGQVRSAEFFLRPGFYLLLDDLRGHYAAGAAVPIVVL